MKRYLTFLMLTALTGIALSSQAMSAQYSERVQYLGTLNGQGQQGDVIKVMRTLTEPVLFANRQGESLPVRLLVRGAQVRPATGGMSYITVRQALPEGKDARITLQTALWVDAKRVPFTAEQRGEDVVINVPVASSRVELRADAPSELEVSANYRGELQLVLEVAVEE